MAPHDVVSTAEKTFVARIASVNGEPKGAKGSMLYTIATSDGYKMMTWKAEIAEQARGFQGTVARVAVSEKLKENGYTDNQLNKIEEAGEGAVPDAHVGPVKPDFTPPAKPASGGKTDAEWRAEHVSGDMRACIAIATSSFEPLPAIGANGTAITQRADEVLKLARHYFDAVQQQYGLTKSVIAPDPVGDDIPF